jgi:hypothetical protein
MEKDLVPESNISEARRKRARIIEPTPKMKGDLCNLIGV